MKYCPYCGTVLIDSAVSFCMECGKKLPIKDEESSVAQNNDHDEVAQEAVGFGMESRKEKYQESAVRNHRKNGMILESKNEQRKRNVDCQSCLKRKAEQ